ncbi:SrfA family protein [Pseudomonas lundensis]|uniref:SrfA family protein n=1 Tax=Serratia proteamaculans TaxID=28151 RepID=UPI002981B09D|nr:SrfA family protein [Serratia proteamaculans]MDW5500880.1 SrfA family protein [Serratia proteamaculans]MDW5505944.1 SrfA family protein [Pseudomonas lundensis]
MVKPFLRSGSLDDVLALGENGQPVYVCAQQLRETLRIRQQQQAADCLAIPQPNETGTRIDWYSPFPGKVTSWLAASDVQRRQAVGLLEESLETFRSLAAQAQANEHPSHRLFGALLAKAMQIPDPNHVYLVDGKPVLTFWGFIKPQAQCQDDPLVSLRPVEPAAEKPTPIAAVRPSVAVVIPTVETVPLPAAVPARRPWRRYLWILPGLMLIALLIAFFSMPKKSQPAPPVVTQLAPVALPVPTLKLQLPLALATVMPPAPIVLPPADKNALVMPANSVKAGSIGFLNGKWRATVALKDLPTGKRPSLQYRIKEGKGTASIAYGDGVTCRVPVEAGLMQSGNLIINSRTKARCSDGSRYSMPEIVCKQNEASPAECIGRYDADTTYPMILKRESK